MTSLIEKNAPIEQPLAWLQPHRERFLQNLGAQGYALDTVRKHDTAIKRFFAAIQKSSIPVSNLEGQQIEMLCAAVLDETKPSICVSTKFLLNRFIDHLVKAGVARRPEPPQNVLTALDHLREEYGRYLRQQRGLSERTIYHCLRFLHRFMTFRFGETLGDLNDITSADIIAFLVKVMRGTQAFRDKTPPTHLRSLFRFLFATGKTKHDLASSIPRVAQPPQTQLPRYLKPEQIDKLIDSVWSEDPIGRRNYAMLLVSARLGLRAPEVIAIRLDDIDWRAGEIMIRGKGKQRDRMPLPEDVGKAIVDYIRNGRTGNSRTLFVSGYAPYRPFVNAQILNATLHTAFKQTGLQPPQRFIGSHLLRHSLATDMLRKGASLDEIGDVLRHRSRISTMVYAKHDISALRSIARTWPAAEGSA